MPRFGRFLEIIGYNGTGVEAHDFLMRFSLVSRTLISPGKGQMRGLGNCLYGNGRRSEQKLVCIASIFWSGVD